MEQGSAEWLAARAGCVTASRLGDVLAKIKTGEAAVRRNYRMQLVTERLTGLPTETYENAAMRWGKEQEPFARMAIESTLGYFVDEVGFLKHPEIEWCGASPDGLIEADGGIEIKCPYNSVAHVETLTNGVPAEHIPQIQGNLWVTGRKWWLFASFDPRMPEHLRLFTAKVERDETYIQKLEAEVKKFLAEVDAMVEQLSKKAA